MPVYRMDHCAAIARLALEMRDALSRYTNARGEALQVRAGLRRLLAAREFLARLPRGEKSPCPSCAGPDSSSFLGPLRRLSAFIAAPSSAA